MKSRHFRAIGVLAALVALAPLFPSSAQSAGVPGDEQVTLLFDAPVHESVDLVARHNQEISVAFPAGFIVQECVAQTGWACAQATASARWVRLADNMAFAATDVFRVIVHTPAVPLEVIRPALTQVYSDGETVVWDGQDASGANPAPEFTVITEPERTVAPAVAVGAFQSIPGTTALVITGTAKLTRTADSTTIEVAASGLDSMLTYASHLHELSCAESGPHYQNDPYGEAEPPNELWPSTNSADPHAGLTTDWMGQTTGAGTAPWVARPTARSVRIHAPGGHHEPGQIVPMLGEVPGAAIACADLVPAPAPAG